MNKIDQCGLISRGISSGSVEHAGFSFEAGGYSIDFKEGITADEARKMALTMIDALSRASERNIAYWALVARYPEKFAAYFTGESTEWPEMEERRGPRPCEECGHVRQPPVYQHGAEPEPPKWKQGREEQ